MSRPANSIRVALLCLAFCGACGDSPPPVDSGSTADLPSRFAGSVSLRGDLATVESGSLYVSVRPPGSRFASLARKYEIGDPAFAGAGDERLLRFSLDERDAMESVRAPMFEEMEVEARFDPDGVLDTMDGVVRSTVRARPGAREVAIVVERHEDAPPIAGSTKDS